jgi:hypothetical protein
VTRTSTSRACSRRWTPSARRAGSVGAASRGSRPLPPVGPDRRLRWSLKKLHGELDAQRRERGLTWNELAAELRCTPSQLTGIRTARFAIGMRLAMRITRWLRRPASDFVYRAMW